MENLQSLAYELRQNVLDMVVASRGGHIGGDMSVMEILLAVYERLNLSPQTADDPNRDRFVLSKGHAVEALYAVLAHRGFMDIKSVIAGHSQFGSDYIGHPNNKLPGVEINSGSLGHGLSVGVGMALAGKLDQRSYRVYVVMGDGELAEGSVWEAAMAASHFKLDNLCAVVDRNRLQISGGTEEIMAQDDVARRFVSFGWNAAEVAGGNDIAQLRAALDGAERVKGCPTVLVADTVKGCGSAVMENKAEWHHKVPDAAEYQQITADFAARRKRDEHDC